jgi:hypothetical protein
VTTATVCVCKSQLEYIVGGDERVVACTRELNALEEDPSTPTEQEASRMAALVEQLELLDADTLEQRARLIAEGVGLHRARWYSPLAELSGGTSILIPSTLTAAARERALTQNDRHQEHARDTTLCTTSGNQAQAIVLPCLSIPKDSRGESQPTFQPTFVEARDFTPVSEHAAPHSHRNAHAGGAGTGAGELAQFTAAGRADQPFGFGGKRLAAELSHPES